MLEKTVEEILKRHADRIWPDLRLVFVGCQTRLQGGKILDLCFRSPDLVYNVVELKRNRVNGSTVRQLVGYLGELAASEPEKTFKGIVAGFSVSDSALTEAGCHGIDCRKLDESLFRQIALEYGLELDHAAGHRPKLTGSNRSRSKSMPSRNRPPPSADIIALLRKLDERFAPGSLTGKTAMVELRNYWACACPDAPKNHHELAARLTFEVLHLVPTAAVARRSESKSDPYSTICAIDGRVAAVIDARRQYVKLDFPLPFEAAKSAADSGLLGIWNARGYSYWVQSRVGARITIEQALSLLKLGLEFEFKMAPVTVRGNGHAIR